MNFIHFLIKNDVSLVRTDQLDTTKHSDHMLGMWHGEENEIGLKQKRWHFCSHHSLTEVSTAANQASVVFLREKNQQTPQTHFRLLADKHNVGKEKKPAFKFGQIICML